MAKQATGGAEAPTRGRKSKETAAPAVPAPEPQAAGRTRYDVEPETFIRTWQESDSAEEVARKLGMPKPIVHARATGYREKGVKLKSMPRLGKNKALDVAALNAIIDEVNKQKGIADTEARKKAPMLDQATVAAVVEQVLSRLPQAAARR